MKRIFNTSIIYFFAAMVGGVFYREFTKMMGFTGNTALSVVHTHLLALGTILFLIIAIFANIKPALLESKKFNTFYILYNIALPLMVVMFVVRGILQVLAVDTTGMIDGMVSGFAGISHILIAVALYMLLALTKKHFAEGK